MAIGGVVTDATPESVLFTDNTDVATTRQIANRGCFLNTATAGASQANTQTYHFARDDITSIQIGWAGFYVAAGVEAANTGVNTITAALWVDGTAHQLLFSAVATGTIPNGGYLISDALTVSIPAGAKFYIRTYNVYSVAALSRAKATTTRDTANGDAVNHTAADQTMSGSVTDAGGAIAGLWPSLLLGSSTRPAILLIGDSRSSGETTDSYSDGAGYIGNIERSVGPSFATLNAANNADQAQYFASRAFTQTVFTYFTHVICELGFNDAFGGANTATVLARLQTVYAMFSGQKIFQTTFEPYTTSTDAWVTIANQTVTATEPARLGVNAAVRAGPLANTEGYFDIASTMESSLNSGKWKVPAYTTDGIHATQFGYQQTALAEIFPPGSFVGDSVVLAEDNAYLNYSPGTRTLRATNIELQSLSFAAGIGGDHDLLVFGPDNAMEALANALYKIPHASGDNWFVAGSGNTTLTGYFNVGLGDLAVRDVTTGIQNLGIGSAACLLTTTGSNNTGIGNVALGLVTTGSDNVGIGNLAGLSLTNGSQNICVGSAALNTAVGVTGNTAIGYGAMRHGAAGTRNVAIGDSALDNVVGDYNVGIGYLAGGALTTAFNNTLIGTQAFYGANTSSSHNTMVGYQAGLNITSGDYNTLLGKWLGPVSALSNVIALSDGVPNLYLDYNYTNAATWTSPKAICVTPVLVAALPAAGIMGRRHFVSDATVTLFGTVVAGTGGNPVPVYDDGTNWRIG